MKKNNIFKSEKEYVKENMRSLIDEIDEIDDGNYFNCCDLNFLNDKKKLII